jgi:hypothetical protein
VIEIIEEQDNYLLVTDGTRFTVVERRAGKFYSLRNGARRSAMLDDAGFAQIIRETGFHTALSARQLFDEVAARRQDLAEHLR